MATTAGAQFGRLIKIADKRPANLLVGGLLLYNALRPTGTWQLRYAGYLHLLSTY